MAENWNMQIVIQIVFLGLALSLLGFLFAGRKKSEKTIEEAVVAQQPDPR